MYEVTKKERLLEGGRLETWERDIVSCNILQVEAGTNGFHGGDGGSGCRTYIRIENLASTSIQVRMIGENGGDGLEIVLSGDTELSTMLEALEFIQKVLKDQIEEAEENENCIW